MNSFRGSVWDRKKTRDTFYVKVILSIVVAFAALNLSPWYRAAQARNRETVHQIFIPTTEGNDPR